MFTERNYSQFLLGAFACFLVACSFEQPKEEETTLELINEALESAEQYTAYRLDSVALIDFIRSKTVYGKDSVEILDFYTKRDLQYAWFVGDSLSDAAASFLSLFSALNVDAIDTLGRHALLTKRVQQALDRDRGAGLSLVEKSRLEMDLTAQFFRQAQKEYGGHVETDLHELEWYIPRRKKDYNGLLTALVEQRSDLAIIEPVHPQYRALKKELQRLYALAEIRDSVEFNTGEKLDLEIGDSSEIIPLIRERLFELGDMLAVDTLQRYDSALYVGVKRFRARTGLSPIENINKYFIAEIEIPIRKRIQTILLNMERCRWLPEKQPENLILVNIPEFMLHLYQDGKLLWDMNVVVGKKASMTTIFSGDMDRLVFAPFWNVPSSIKNDEILPKLKKDPTYLSRNNYELRRGNKTVDASKLDYSSYETVLPYLIRQKPGRSNALGKVKFLFPNEYAIYLHDTPSKSKFKRTQRAFSHGCIRLSEPQKLAAYLLRSDTAWTTDSVQTAMNHSKQTIVMLDEKMPVVLAYLTAWVNEAGILNFREDVYAHDKRLANALFGKSLSKEPVL